MNMERTEIIIKKVCRGSEDGITVQNFVPSNKPIAVEVKLAAVFVKEGLASYPSGDKKTPPGPTERKVVKPETKTIIPDETKKKRPETV